MSYSDASSQQLFELLAQLLDQLASQDNTVRSAAEEQLNNHWLVHQSPALLAGLAYLSAHHPSVEVRSFAAVLLRRVALRSPEGAKNNATYFIASGEESRTFVQSQLLQSLLNEQQATVRNKVCDTVCELAEELLSHGGPWAELVQAMQHFSKSADAAHRQTAYQIVGGVPSLFVDENPATVLAILGAGIQDQHVDVRLAAVKASSYFLIEADDKARQSMAGLVPQMLNVLPPILSDSTQEEAANEALGYLIDLAESHHELFRSSIPQLLEFMIATMRNADLEDNTRQTCLELLLTLAEVAPRVMRKHPAFCQGVIPLMIDWMCEHEDDDEWYETEDLDDIDQEANETVGEQSMDRIARYMGGKIVLPIAFNIIPVYLSSNEWQRRHAALRCISAIGEGCHTIMNAELDKVVSLVLPHLRDPHPRVRHAACNAIGQMCTDFAPKIQDKFHEAILTSLIPVMDDEKLRVKTYAAAALVNFSENAKKECIAPYLDAIIPKLLGLLNTGKIYSQEQAVTSLATVADSAADQFTKYYQPMMTVLMNILRVPNNKEYRSLRGKALECATLIAMAVGKDVFGPNATEFIEVLQHVQGQVTDSDDPQSSYLLSAWARVCKILGQDFAPYMGIVLPPLFASAQLKPDIAIFEEEDPNDEEGWEMLQMHGQRVGIKTSILEEKCTAVEMLLCYAKELGPLFHQYVEETMRMILPLLTFYFHDGVRFAAAAVIPLLFESWAKANYPREKVTPLWHEVAMKLIETLKGETDLQMVGQIYDTFQETLEAVGPMSLNEAILTAFVKQTLAQLSEFVSRCELRQKLRDDPDYDPEEEEAIQDDEFSDETLTDCIAHAVRAIFKTHHATFLPYFNEMVPTLESFLVSKEAAARRLSLSIFQDLIEFTTVESVQYQPRFLERMLGAILDKDPNVRQTAAYGIGSAAKLGGETYRAVTISALPSLAAVIRDPNARKEENTLATENAVAAVGKICKAHGASGAFDINQVLPAWFDALPIVEDQEEFDDAYTFLLDLIEAGHPALPLSNPAILAKLVDILTQVLAVPGLKDKDALVARMLAVLKRLLSQCDDATRTSLWASLPEDRRKMLTAKSFF
ncbi:importin subunit beta-3 [Polyrhizophydium stewartii]|uniref:Importin subunit beta-3 n=1 Tax=Polyrhizophydium stewartii TaxID=2732419 RepID=A0ABR4MXC9_9FUNG|nr:hypothetical protein HK105_000224 [Polyrhizophydium stewartii]